MALPTELSYELLHNVLTFRRRNPQILHEDLRKKFNTSLRVTSFIDSLLFNEKAVRKALREVPKYRVLLAGDFHCGHKAGLTPKGYQIPLDSENERHYAEFQRETWDFFERQILELSPFSHAIFNGDLIDGRGKKSKGTEQLTTDRLTQVDMAEKVVRTVNATYNVFTYGTPYHTGDGEDYEKIIAQRVGGILNPENLINIGGVILNVKHHTNGSGVPYGAATPLLKDALWTDIWAHLEDNPTADIVVRSHTHTFLKVNDGFRTAIVLPALQGAMTKYGTVRCTKVVHWGFAYVDIFDDRRFELHEVMYLPESQKRKVIEL